MKCQNCGVELNNKEKICKKCKDKIKNTDNILNNKLLTKQKKNYWRMPITLLMVYILLTIIYILLGLFTLSEKELILIYIPREQKENLIIINNLIKNIGLLKRISGILIIPSIVFAIYLNKKSRLGIKKEGKLLGVYQKKDRPNITLIIIMMIICIIFFTFCYQKASNNATLKGKIGLKNSDHALKYNIPSGYKASNNNYKTIINNDKEGPKLVFFVPNNNCEIVIEVTNTNETVEEEFNNEYGTKPILEKTINQNNWKYIKTDTFSLSTKLYDYRLIIKNTEYILSFYEEENNICPKKRQEILNSLKIVYN